MDSGGENHLIGSVALPATMPMLRTLGSCLAPSIAGKKRAGEHPLAKRVHEASNLRWTAASALLDVVCICPMV